MGLEFSYNFVFQAVLLVFLDLVGLFAFHNYYVSTHFKTNEENDCLVNHMMGEIIITKLKGKEHN